MKLTKKVQNGLLFVMYALRGGTVKIEDAAANLNLDKSFLSQVANKLKQAGVMKSKMGPGGGYTVVDDEVSVGQIIKVLTEKQTVIQFTNLANLEYRALDLFLSDNQRFLNRIPVISLLEETINTENYLFDQTPVPGGTN